MENVLVIGTGGRAHAICWKLAQCPEVKHIFSAPGSHGIALTDKVESVSVDTNNFKLLGEWAKTQNVKMVVVGPEVPLANGIADALTASGILCFGPKANAARIESDKEWAKKLMTRFDIPTAKFGSFTDAEKAKQFIKTANFKAHVVKASGLAAGKGVVVASNNEEACAAVDMMLKDQKFGDAGATVVIEELLEGEEVSVLAFTDGTTVRTMLPAQDHKRALDGDKGDNTGGMGAYCPCPLIDEDELNWVTKNVLQKTVDGMKKENTPFVGVLYAGLMLTKDGPKVLEFNCRFGDPETEVILPLLESNLYQVMKACCEGKLEQVQLKWKENISAAGAVMCSRGYPETSSKGDVITGLEVVNHLPSMTVFHCGTLKKGDKWVTNGGRVLINVSLAPSLITAAAKATQACSMIQFDGAHYRKDIAYKGIPRWILNQGQLSYKASGVDISAGDMLVNQIKPSAGSTTRSGVISTLGGFGAFFDTSLAGYKNHVLVSGTDGAGTKLKIAQACGMHKSIGIDLVAMCVNDILCHGAEPLFFLDYFACGKLEVGVAKDVVAGVAEGCKMSGCALVGGETAEMPGLYAEGEYDLAGFSVGAVEKGFDLPKTGEIKPGDVVLALPSSGPHSNGYSLVRKVLEKAGVDYKDKCPFSDKTIGEELLTPTRIYIAEVLPVLKEGIIKAVAHITGGGLVENVPRVLTEKLKIEVDAKRWTVPKVFPWLAALGGINQKEMLRTFNCGVGLVLVVNKEAKSKVMSKLPDCCEIGLVKARLPGEAQVDVKNFSEVFTPLMKPYIEKIVHKARKTKRIGVLISGTGTNLQSIIDNITAGNINGEIVVVVSNKEGVLGLERAKKAGIPTVVVPHGKYVARDDFEMEITRHLEASNVEVVVLAGFMRILTKCFVSRWRGKLINIHPALLPSFKGTNGWQQALDAGVRVSGCTVHFVEVEVDGGAIIAQEVVSVEVGESIDSLKQKISSAEKKALPRAVQLLCNDSCTLDLKTGKAIWV
ncbi:trifunctional purine biosynthetic protein adenosine-3 [Cimex lectularius]|uniref:Trifunctional purine biosynthetic protein adenosine-3 n=1 Tax=Cimex lectularius TaxID=79782 RepID=A0A8I6RBI7_CIMLE|nr:trifunctional purine biosynthetic protein adenosine-3 [Cimex lectularius]XP_014242116.1 trifunctional purine biosynthetic protein adenosine-3 [Cimex lectularius]XP_014242117.1 trifunctional purine biosynthetic protein adenosine-3 [Cimex lectularius]